jgi:hypothetical protein
MQIGVVYPQIELGGDPEAVRRIGRATDALGFDHLLAYDHVLVQCTRTGSRPWSVRTPSAIRSTTRW